MKRFLIEFSLGLLVIGLAILVIVFWFEPYKFKYWPILMSLVIIYFSIILIRYVLNLDEMYRKIVSEAMALAGFSTVITCVIYFLLIELGAPEFKPFWAFYILITYYAIGAMFLSSRYQK